MEESDIHNEHELRKPRGMILLCGLYLFFFLLTVSSYGQPIPYFGTIYFGSTANALVFIDSLVCLYLFLGLMKRQYLTWYLLLGYNTFEVVNTLINLLKITPSELENVVGKRVDSSGLLAGNITVIVAILLLSALIIHLRGYFTNHSKFLF